MALMDTTFALFIMFYPSYKYAVYFKDGTSGPQFNNEYPDDPI